MSLDGFIAGPDVSIAHPMGVGGERLHEWLFAPDRDAADTQVAGEMFSHQTTGAVLMGNTTFTVGEAPWGDDGAFGMPCFVVTRHARPMLRKQETTFTFVTRGLADAFEQARRAATGKNVNVMGANTIQQVLAAGVLDSSTSASSQWPLVQECLSSAEVATSSRELAPLNLQPQRTSGCACASRDSPTGSMKRAVYSLDVCL